MEWTDVSEDARDWLEMLGEPSLKRLIDNTTTRAALLAEVTRATDLIDDLVRELRYIEGINGQVQMAAKQALAKLPDNVAIEARP